MRSRVIVAGVGMIPFAKPGASAAYHEMGAEAGRRALADAGVGYDASSRPTPATSTATPRPASGRSTSSA